MNRYEQCLHEFAQRHDNLIVMTAENRAALRNLPAILGPRFIDVGIAEQTMIGMASGLALRGNVPVVHALATFLTLRAFEFIRTDVGIGQLPVKLVGAVAGFLSEANGPTHQAIEDVALMRGIPNMGVFCPCDEYELIAGLPSILSAPQPFYIRYNAAPAHGTINEAFRIGGSVTMGEGDDVAIITYGFLLKEAIKAKAVLESRGISVRIVYLRTVVPIDEYAIIEAAQNCRLVITLEDHFQIGGLYSIMAEVLLANRIRADVQPIALTSRWFKPALLADVLVHEGFTGELIAARIMNIIDETVVIETYF